MFVTVVSMGVVFVYTTSAGTSNVNVRPSALSVRSAPTAVRQTAAAAASVKIFAFMQVSFSFKLEEVYHISG